jgi:hypothetical protein
MADVTVLFKDLPPKRGYRRRTRSVVIDGVRRIYESYEAYNLRSQSTHKAMLRNAVDNLNEDESLMVLNYINLLTQPPIVQPLTQPIRPVPIRPNQKNEL